MEFFKRKCHQKIKGGRTFFLSSQIFFFAELAAGKFCQELATLTHGVLV
jgi:hypothetical protein